MTSSLRQAALLLAFLGLFSAQLTAQKPTVKISPEFKLSKSKSFQDHLFSDATGHYMYFYDQKVGLMGDVSTGGVILEKYDASFKPVFSKEFESDRKGVSSLGMTYFQKQFAWLVSERNKKEDYVRYTILPIGLDGKQKKAVDLARFKYENSDDIPSIRWAVSRDSSKLMFAATVDNNDDEKKVGMFVSVLQGDLTPVWTRKLKLRYTEEQVEVISTLVKNDGTVMMLAKVYEGEKAKESKRNDKKKSVAAYDMMLFQFAKDQEEPKEFKLNLGEAFIRGASLADTKENELECVGFYANTRKGSIQGVFFLRLGPDGAVLSSSKREFSAADLKVIGKENTDKDKDGDEGIEDNFKFSDILVLDDGTTVVVAEQNYRVVHTTYNGRTWTTYVTYHSNDIIMFTISAKGEVQRVNVIPKFQAARDTDFFLSYVALANGNNTVFFYNEDEDNMKKPVNNPKPKLVNSFKEAVAVMTTLDPTGKLTRKPLFQADDVESLFVPNNSRPISKNQLFFVTTKPRFLAKSNFRIGTITLPAEVR